MIRTHLFPPPKVQPQTPSKSPLKPPLCLPVAVQMLLRTRHLQLRKGPVPTSHQQLIITGQPTKGRIISKTAVDEVCGGMRHYWRGRLLESHIIMYPFIIPKQLLWRSRGIYYFSIVLQVFHSVRRIGLVFIEFVLTCPSLGSTYIANEDETPHVPKGVRYFDF